MNLEFRLFWARRICVPRQPPGQVRRIESVAGAAVAMAGHGAGYYGRWCQGMYRKD